MQDIILKIFNWLSSIWSSLPDETKKKIIENITETFDKIFRDFYQSQQNKKPGEPDANS